MVWWWGRETGEGRYECGELGWGWNRRGGGGNARGNSVPVALSGAVGVSAASQYLNQAGNWVGGEAAVGRWCRLCPNQKECAHGEGAAASGWQWGIGSVKIAQVALGQANQQLRAAGHAHANQGKVQR